MKDIIDRLIQNIKENGSEVLISGLTEYSRIVVTRKFLGDSQANDIKERKRKKISKIKTNEDRVTALAIFLDDYRKRKRYLSLS